MDFPALHSALFDLRTTLLATGKPHGRTSLYNAIRDGLWTKPVRAGTRSVAWPAREVEALNAARIAGKTDDEIRALVRRLESARVVADTP